jgi:hypothetical protein
MLMDSCEAPTEINAINGMIVRQERGKGIYTRKPMLIPAHQSKERTR